MLSSMLKNRVAIVANYGSSKKSSPRRNDYGRDHQHHTAKDESFKESPCLTQSSPERIQSKQILPHPTQTTPSHLEDGDCIDDASGSDYVSDCLRFIRLPNTAKSHQRLPSFHHIAHSKEESGTGDTLNPSSRASRKIGGVV